MNKLLLIPIIGAILIFSLLAIGYTFMLVPRGGTAYTGDWVNYTFTLTNLDAEALPKSRYDADGDGTPDTQIRLYKGMRITDPAKNIEWGCVNATGDDIDCNLVKEIGTIDDTGEASGSIASGATVTIDMNFLVRSTTPSSIDGNPYGGTATLFKVTEVWDRDTNTWTQTPSPVNTVNQPDCSDTVAYPDQLTCDADNSCEWVAGACRTKLGYEFYVKTQAAPDEITGEILSNWLGAILEGIWNFICCLFGWACCTV